MTQEEQQYLLQSKEKELQNLEKLGNKPSKSYTLSIFLTAVLVMLTGNEIFIQGNQMTMFHVLILLNAVLLLIRSKQRDSRRLIRRETRRRGIEEDIQKLKEMLEQG